MLKLERVWVPVLLTDKRKTLNNNDLSQVADQRFSLKQWFAVGVRRVLILAGPGKLILSIVIEGFPGQTR